MLPREICGSQIKAGCCLQNLAVVIRPSGPRESVLKVLKLIFSKMGFGQSSLFAKIGFILIIVALVIQILGVALPYWYSVDYGSISAYGGLWKGCVESGNTKSCSDINNPSDWWAATQAMEIIGLILIIIALVLSIITVFVKNDMKVLKLICWILCFCACAFIIIGIIIFGAEAPSGFDEYSGAFAITIIAGIIILVAGILVLLDWMGKGSS